MEANKITNEMLLHLFRQCSHLQFRRFSRFPGRGRLMILLSGGGMTQRKLGEITQRRASTLSEQLEKMEKSGLIVRTKNLADKRNIDIALTPKGEEMAQEIKADRLETADTLFSSLQGDERTQFFATLEKLQAQWQQDAMDREVHS